MESSKAASLLEPIAVALLAVASASKPTAVASVPMLASLFMPIAVELSVLASADRPTAVDPLPLAVLLWPTAVALSALAVLS